MIYSVYIGYYANANVGKSDLKKLNELGLKGYMFSRGDHYALKVYSSLDKQKAIEFQKLMIMKNFVTELEETSIKRNS